MGRVHIVGAGLSGLACAVALSKAGRDVVLYEAAGEAGGRCRSYYDQFVGTRIDNGNHLLLSANTNALSYLEDIGARDTLIDNGPVFPFVDLATGERWTVRPGRGPVPFWLLQGDRGVPGVGFGEYSSAASVLFAGESATVGDCVANAPHLTRRFWEPFTEAVLNTGIAEASARLLRSVLLKSFARGAQFCRPLMARDGLSESFVFPALEFLGRRGHDVRMRCRLREIERRQGQVVALNFGEETVSVGGDDYVVMALPATVAASLLPEIEAPAAHNMILNAHLRLDEAPAMPHDSPFIGVIGGTSQWLMARGTIVSATVSAANRFADAAPETLADLIWADVRAVFGLEEAARPAIRVIKEKRATFAQTPAAVAGRPGTRTSTANLRLAGDWTDTGLPATIEGAVTSGGIAARSILDDAGHVRAAA